MYSLVAIGISAFLLALLLTPVVRGLSRRWNILDHPDGHRKSHAGSVPRIGGIAVALAYGASYLVLLALPLQAVGVIERGFPLIARVLPAAVVILLVGLIDDIAGLRPWQKLTGQIAAGLLAFWAGIHLHNLGGLPLGDGWGLVCTVAWLVLCSNAFNLIDGVDGLATGLALFAAATTLLAGLTQPNIPLALATAPLVGVLLGFLRYNFNPATIFLGDCGALFVGFLLGCYGILWSQKSATLLGMTAPLMALSIPLLDTGLAVARRFLRRQPLFKPDRGHIHHRLLDRGHSPRRTVLSMYAFCAMGACCAVAVANKNIGGLVAAAFCLLVLVGIWLLGYVEFGMAARMLVAGAFRRQLNSGIALDAMERDLVAASTPDQCWTVIERAATELGYHHVEMSLAGQVFRHRNGAAAGSSWNIRIPISNSDYLDLARGFGGNSHASAVGPFADIVKRTLAPKLEATASLSPLYRITEPETRESETCIFINQFFWPDSAATSQLLTDLLTQALRDGCRARVICAANRYAGDESVPPPSVAIHRCPALPFVRGIAGRLISYLSFLASATVHGLRGPRPGAIVTLTTPPGLAWVGTIIHTLRGARHYIWEMDVYPDIAFDLKVLPDSALLKRVLTWIFDLPRRRADGIIALGEDMKARLVAHGIAPEKIWVCHNWADGGSIFPLPFPEGPLTVQYSGNFGLAHELATIRETIVHFANHPRFRFVFAGGGKHQAALQTLCRESAIENVAFEPYCPREQLGAHLSEGHIGLVTQLPESLGTVVPSKVYGIMAAGRPVLYIGPAEATPARIVQEHRCGWHIDTNNVDAVIALLEHLAAHRDQVEAAGARSRQAFEQHYEREIAIARILDVLNLHPAPLPRPAAHAASATAR